MRFVVLLIFALITNAMFAQIIIPKSLSVRKTWTDGNGLNTLNVNVSAACFPDDEYSQPGYPTEITATLDNSRYKLVMSYNVKNYQMEMIHLNEEDLFFCDLNGINAVLIPFSYCGNADDDMVISYIVLYAGKKYLFHINLRGSDFANYKVNDNLDKKLKALPDKLKSTLIEHIDLQCKKTILIEETEEVESE